MAKTINKTVYNFEEISNDLNSYLSPEKIEEINVLGDNIRNIVISNPISNTTNLEDIRIKFAEVTELWKEYQTAMGNLKYNYPFTLEDKNFLITTITKEININSDNVFLAMRVRDRIIKPLLATTAGKGIIPITIDEVTLLYHLIKTMNYKGIESQGAIIFGVVIAKIGAINKIYDDLSKYAAKVSEEVTRWTTDIDNLELKETGSLNSPELVGPSGS